MIIILGYNNKYYVIHRGGQFNDLLQLTLASRIRDLKIFFFT